MHANEVPTRGDSVSLGEHQGEILSVARVSDGVVVSVVIRDEVDGVPVPAPAEDHSGEFTGTTGPRTEPGRREPVEAEAADAVDSVRPGDESVNDVSDDPAEVAAAVNEHVGDDGDHEPNQGTLPGTDTGEDDE